MIQAKNIHKSYGSVTVLDDASFSLDKGQKVALVGDNGIGKTTILKIITGIEESDAGTIEINKNACIGYLPQDTSLVGEETIETYLRHVTKIDFLEDKMEELAGDLTNSAKAQEYGDLQEQYEKLDGYAFEHRVKVMLSGFGLDGVGLNTALSNLSSGQKSKIILAGILLKGVDLLLLDEPTNNLDLPALIWLEDFLIKSEAAAIIVSHDRRFLDRVVRKIFEIDRNTRTLNISGGTYSDYLEMVAKRIARQKEDYRFQQEEIERLNIQARKQRDASARGSHFTGSDNDKFARGFKRNRSGSSARKAKTIEKRIEQMEKIERPIERYHLEIPIEIGSKVGTLDISLNDVVAGYPNGFTIGPLSLDVRFGSRVGIMGLNGSGKSTLLKTIAEILPSVEGDVEIGSGVKIGNMMQEHESLSRDETLLQVLMDKGGLTQELSYAKLTKFGFDENQVKRTVADLSPGERARLLLALFSAQSVNTLVLDEPTNHLDIEALNALEETLTSYEGTVLLVSHDRYFLETAKLDDVYVLSGGVLNRIPDYKTYISEAESKAQRLLKTL